MNESGRITPNARLASRASRMDFEGQDEENDSGQISAREPLQNRDYLSKDIYDNKVQYAKQAAAMRKRTQTPSDKVSD